ncbi:TPA: hypothetical protein I7759_05230 [Vibrio vulnificus]|uniref:PD-(D/E)XK nuclease family protein n=1 Tax=Vibrio alfacsensis TaxID=1074311 RepID=UPI001A1EDAEA|nr:PD-(D/E)XK nuclease family protein [Vibrio alfacsensis]EGR0237719.1 hypothetical protein [Vibrio vulnificus]MCU8217407.1 PD-(D/E)XK nuclease family protein [Vibrio vulnificus]MCU8243537.1 PD-(D/E)XK nuclease family protein [Vibrio vulnificus]BBM66764.1 hypothetical protein VA249_34100 [Vibrio alfacsensis]HAS8381556.1 hypothetical protein [Vibrio vulnificus]
MDTNVYPHLQRCINDFKQLPKTTTEATIFSIGSRGYYENPTTDILAFFCDPNGEHGLGALVLSALLESLSLTELKAELSSAPTREVVTQANSRIDLLLESDDWVMVIENKIYHEQNNPFDSYEAYVQQGAFSKQTSIFVVLSPTGGSPDGYPQWQGLSYPTLIEKTKAKLAEHFISQPLSKWTVLLRDFLLHLENILMDSKHLQANTDFILNNYQELKDIAQLKSQVFIQLEADMKQHLAAVFEQPIHSKPIKTWNKDNDAIRFALSQWLERDANNESDIVLFLDSQSTSGMAINFYLYFTTEEQKEIALNVLAQHPCRYLGVEADSYVCFTFNTITSTDLNHLKSEVEDKLTLLQELDALIRQ